MANNTAMTAHSATLNFLLQNGHCGYNNATTEDDIVNHLNGLGMNFDRESFQQQVLTGLKDAGTLATKVYPGPHGGVFIPCNDAELHQVTEQVFDRVTSELTHLRGSATGSGDERIIRIFERIAEAFKDLL